jgi:hypothetical protein
VKTHRSLIACFDLRIYSRDALFGQMTAQRII